MNPTTRRILHLVAALTILGGGIAAFVMLTASKPQLKRTEPPAPVPTVLVVRVQTGRQSISVVGEGTVQPLREIQLVPQVGGKLVFVSPDMVDGGTFRKGEVLVRIDPVDYQLAVTLAQARVKDAESKLKVAEEEAAASREEWRLLYTGTEDAGREPPALVAKEPQLAAAKALLDGERAELQKARLSLARTELNAPFNGRVSQENLDVGQYVTAGQSLATLFSTEAAEIVVPLEDENLFWFQVPGFTPGEGPGAKASVRARIAGRDLSWEGRVVRAEGKLDERTRLINVVIRVEKPYEKRPPLAAGLFVRVEIEGRSLEKAAVIPRSALRANNRVWVVDESGVLSFRQVDVARTFPDRVVLKAGLADGERVVTSSLSAVTDGMRVRVSSPVEDNPS